MEQATDDEVKLTVKPSATGGFKLQIVDDDDDEYDSEDSDTDSDDGRPAHAPGHLVCQTIS